MAIYVNGTTLPIEDELVPLIGSLDNTDEIHLNYKLSDVKSVIQSVEIVYELNSCIEDFNEATRGSDLEEEFQYISERYDEWESISLTYTKIYELLQVKDTLVRECMKTHSPCGYYKNYRYHVPTFKDDVIIIGNGGDAFRYLPLTKWCVSVGWIIPNMYHIHYFMRDFEVFKWIWELLKATQNDAIDIIIEAVNTDCIPWSVAYYIVDRYFPGDQGLPNPEDLDAWVKKYR